jgi:hypothetical protein
MDKLYGAGRDESDFSDGPEGMRDDIGANMRSLTEKDSNIF